MKKLFILTFVLSGIFAFGANLNGSHLIEPEKLYSKNSHVILLEYNVKGTLTIDGCVIEYDITFTVFPFTIIDGCVVMGEGCPNSGEYDLRGTGEATQEGCITDLVTYSENEFASSEEFSEALKADINRKLNCP